MWVRGSCEQRKLATPPRRLVEALSSVTGDDALAVDDAHWLPDDLVEMILTKVDEAPTGAARATYPDRPLLRELDAALTIHEPASVLTPLTVDEVADVIGRHDSKLDPSHVLDATAGWAGWVVPAIEAGWAEPTMPTELVDAVARRAGASGGDVLRAAQALCLGARMDAAINAALLLDGVTSRGAVERNDLERRLRVSGLVDGERLIPIVATSLRVDLSAGQRDEVLGQLIDLGNAFTPERRDELMVERPLTDDASSAEQIERINAAVRLGDPRATRWLSDLADLSVPDVVQASFVLDMRALRLDRARSRTLSEPCGSRRSRVAAALAGDVSAEDDPPLEISLANQLDAVTHLIRRHVAGKTAGIDAAAAQAVDDAVSSRVDLGLGWTAASLTAPIVAGSGAPSAAVDLLRTARAAELGGRGEQRTQLLLQAYFELATGEFTTSLEVVRAGDPQDATHRERLLLAALDAAIARRSGDTGRLRDAWERSAALLTRRSVTWLLLDPLIEIACAGRRVDTGGRVPELVDDLCTQMAGWPASGRGPADQTWLRLQVAIAGEDWPAARRLGGDLAQMTSADPRITARCAAGVVWAAIAGRQLDLDAPIATDDALDAAVTALVSVEDAWEASRLLGQTALDHPDPAAARTLLERARSLVADPVESADGLVAAGLSEREADVARLVVEGRTYKEIGAQLFISAKTVEHHVARIRQRLGAGSRAELLAAIRDLGEASRGSSADL